MYNQTRTNQGGSVVSFLVVGVVLAAITLGTIYFVQQRNDNSQPVAQSPSPTPSAPAGSQSVSPSPSSQPSKSPSPSATPKPPSPPPTSHPTTGVAPSSDLPVTGPADDLVMAAIPGALLVGALVSYLRSHKTRFGSLRR